MKSVDIFSICSFALAVCTYILVLQFIRVRNLIALPAVWIIAVPLSTTIYFVEYLISNSVTLVIISFLVITLALIIVLYFHDKKTAKVKHIEDRGRKDFLLFKEAVAVFLIVVVVLFLPLLIKTDSLASNDQKPKVEVSRLSGYASHAIDNITHLNIIQFNIEEHHVAYFEKENSSAPMQLAESRSYPQLFHVQAGTLYDGANALNKITGERIEEHTLMLGSYLSLEVGYLALFAALAWLILRRAAIYATKSIPQTAQYLICALVVSMILYLHGVMEMWNGFSSQIAVDFFFLTLIGYWSLRTSASRGWLDAIAIGLISIAIGNTWWLLAPVALVILTLVVIFLPRVTSNFFVSAAIKKLFIIFAGIISLLPALSFLFVSKIDLSEQTTAEGSVYSIEKAVVIPLILLTVLLLIYLFRSHLIKKYLPDLKNLSIFTYTPFIGMAAFTLIYCLYQKLVEGEINYYGVKLLWSAQALVLIVLGIIAFHIYSVNEKFEKFFARTYVNGFFAVITLVASALLIAGIPLKVDSTVENGQNGKKINALTKLSNEIGHEKEIFVYSGTNNVRDFVYNRYLSFIRGKVSFASDMVSKELSDQPTGTSNMKIYELTQGYKPSYVVSIDGCLREKELILEIQNMTEVISIDGQGNIKKCEI